ncbi:hypothetical protein JCM8097_008857 [Rhodosporidiobolus ruineniae]
MGPTGSVLTWAALPEGAAGVGGGGSAAGREEEEEDELRMGAPPRGPGCPPGEAFNVDEWDAQPAPDGEQRGLGREVMDLTGVASDEDSNDKRARRATSAWDAAERRILGHPSSPPPSASLTAGDVWHESDEDFHPPLARRHYVALHSLGAMLDTLSTPICLCYNVSHDNSAARARAAAELRTLDLLVSMLGSLKAHAREEVKDEYEHQVKRMQCVTYGTSPPPPAPSPL